MSARMVWVLDVVASQRAVSRTLVLGYSQGGHVAWMLATTGRFDAVIPVSGTLVDGYQPPLSAGRTTIHGIHGKDDRTVPLTTGAATFQAFINAGYSADYKQTRAGHSLTTIGHYIAPILSATLARTLGPSKPS